MKSCFHRFGMRFAARGRHAVVIASAMLATALFAAVPAWAAGARYQPDPGFNHGRYFIDAFASSQSNSYRAKKLVRLNNGDVIVAGIVPPLLGGNSGGLGLVHYDAAGVRLSWPDAGDFALYQDWLVYNFDRFVPRVITDVKDIKVHGDRIFVLVDSETYSMGGTPPHTYFSGYASDVLVFSTGGAFLGSAEMGGMSAGPSEPRNFHGGGIGVYSTGVFPEVVSLVFGGTEIDSGRYRPVFRRFTVQGDGSLTDQTGMVFPDANNLCANSNNGCEITGVALGGRSNFTAPPRIYLGGSYSNLFDWKWSFAVMRVNSYGTPDTTFDGGLAYISVFTVGQPTEDRGQGIAVVPGSNLQGTEDQIYVAGNVRVNCGNGVAIAKFRADGLGDPTFNNSQRWLLFGHNYSSGNICFIPRTDNYSHAIAVDADGNIAVAGQRNIGLHFGGTGEITVDATLAVVSPNGSLLSFDKYPYTDTAGGTRTRHSGLWGVVASGNGTFTAAGDVRFLTPSNPETGKMQYATIRFADDPPIFKDGFDGVQ